MNLSDEQIQNLASPLMDIIKFFYDNKTNEANFQKWLYDFEKTKEKL